MSGVVSSNIPLTECLQKLGLFVGYDEQYLQFVCKEVDQQCRDSLFGLNTAVSSLVKVLDEDKLNTDVSTQNTKHGAVTFVDNGRVLSQHASVAVKSVGMYVGNIHFVHEDKQSTKLVCPLLQSVSEITKDVTPDSIGLPSNLCVDSYGKIWLLLAKDHAADIACIDLPALQAHTKEDNQVQVADYVKYVSIKCPVDVDLTIFNSITVNRAGTTAILHVKSTTNMSNSILVTRLSTADMYQSGYTSDPTIECAGLLLSLKHPIVQASFHPLSASHVCILTNNDWLSVYNLEVGWKFPEIVFNLTQKQQPYYAVDMTDRTSTILTGFNCFTFGSVSIPYSLDAFSMYVNHPSGAVATIPLYIPDRTLYNKASILQTCQRLLQAAIDHVEQAPGALSYIYVLDQVFSLHLFPLSVNAQLTRTFHKDIEFVQSDTAGQQSISKDVGYLKSMQDIVKVCFFPKEEDLYSVSLDNIAGSIPSSFRRVAFVGGKTNISVKKMVVRTIMAPFVEYDLVNCKNTEKKAFFVNLGANLSMDATLPVLKVKNDLNSNEIVATGGVLVAVSDNQVDVSKDHSLVILSHSEHMIPYPKVSSDSAVWSDVCQSSVIYNSQIVPFLSTNKSNNTTTSNTNNNATKTHEASMQSTLLPMFTFGKRRHIATEEQDIKPSFTNQTLDAITTLVHSYILILRRLQKQASTTHVCTIQNTVTSMESILRVHSPSLASKHTAYLLNQFLSEHHALLAPTSAKNAQHLQLFLLSVAFVLVKPISAAHEGIYNIVHVDNCVSSVSHDYITALALQQNIDSHIALALSGHNPYNADLMTVISDSAAKNAGIMSTMSVLADNRDESVGLYKAASNKPLLANSIFLGYGIVSIPLSASFLIYTTRNSIHVSVRHSMNHQGNEDVELSHATRPTSVLQVNKDIPQLPEFHMISDFLATPQVTLTTPQENVFGVSDFQSLYNPKEGSLSPLQALHVRIAGFSGTDSMEEQLTAVVELKKRLHAIFTHCNSVQSAIMSRVSEFGLVNENHQALLEQSRACLAVLSTSVKQSQAKIELLLQLETLIEEKTNYIRTELQARYLGLNPSEAEYGKFLQGLEHKTHDLVDLGKECCTAIKASPVDTAENEVEDLEQADYVVTEYRQLRERIAIIREHIRLRNTTPNK